MRAGAGRQAAPAGRPAGHGRARARGRQASGSGLWWSRAALASIPGQLPGSMPSSPRRRSTLTSAIFACLVAAGAAWPSRSGRWRGSASCRRSREASSHGRPNQRLSMAGRDAGRHRRRAGAVPAALLAQSLASLRARDAGFVVDDVVVADVAVPANERRAPARSPPSSARCPRRLAALPGTRGVAFAYDHPLEANWTQVMAFAGRRGSRRPGRRPGAPPHRQPRATSTR